MSEVYFDYNATTPVAPEVADAMRPYLGEEFGNASSVHAYGQRAREAVEHARDQVADLLHASAAEIVFTSGGTESDNMAVFGVVEAARSARGATSSGTGAPHVVTSAIEHTAVLHSVRALERRGVKATYVAAQIDGAVDAEEVAAALAPETVLVTVMLANNETGVVQPIAEIGARARGAGVTLHTDAVQAVGKIPVDVEKLGVDLLSLSAHKFHGPKGVGALYVRRGARLEPLMYGGHHERDRRPGTENVPGIVGMGAAAELARRRLAEDSARLCRLRDRLESGLVSRIEGVRINGTSAHRQPNTANVIFDGVAAQSLVMALDLEGVACSTGSACSSGSVEPSHVLTAMGLDADAARSAVRFSLGRYSTEADVDRALAVLPRLVDRLRALSPRWPALEAEAAAR